MHSWMPALISGASLENAMPNSPEKDAEAVPESPFASFVDRPRVYLEALAGILGDNGAWRPTRAARVAGVVHGHADYWRKTVPGFREAEKRAMQLGAEVLRTAAVDRATEVRESHRFTKDGDTIYHPTKCRCGHEDDDHLRQTGPCSLGGCTCEGFRSAPYVDIVHGDVKLMEKVLAAALPEFAEKSRLEVSVLSRVDVRQLPHEAIGALADGEPIEAIVMRMVAKGLAIPMLPPGGDAPLPVAGEIVVEAPTPSASGGEGGAKTEG